MDDTFGCHPVDERDRVPERGLCRREVAIIDGGANALEGAPEPRAQLPVVFAVLQALPVCFGRRRMLGRQFVDNLRERYFLIPNSEFPIPKPVILTYLPCPSSSIA